MGLVKPSVGTGGGSIISSSTKNGNILNNGSELVVYSPRQVDVLNPPTPYLAAVGDGVADDTVALQAILNAGFDTIYINHTHKISDTLVLPSNIVICGTGRIEASLVANDAFIAYGSDVAGSEAQNIEIRGITINNPGRYGIQLFGTNGSTPYAHLPHNIIIDDVKTINGGIFINCATDIKISNCLNDGGGRAITVFSPISNPRITHDVLISNCSSINTNSFCYQTYYSDRVNIIGCHVDGASLVSGDKSGITFDRTTNACAVGNVISNCVGMGIFITGCSNITVGNNVIYKGGYGVQVAYNFEYVEDATIKECLNVGISGNTFNSVGQTAIMLNGVQNATVTGNITDDVVDSSIYLMEELRGDGIQMVSKSISITANICGGNFHRSNGSNPITFIGNKMGTNTGSLDLGLMAKDLVIDQNKGYIFDDVITGLPSTTGVINLPVGDHRTWTLTPTGSCTINATSWNTGKIYTLIITTGSSTAYALTFGTNFKTIGTLSTGTTSGKVFVISFLGTVTNLVETGRTVAM